MPSVRLVALLASLVQVATLWAATPAPAETPTTATPAPAQRPHSLKETVPVESLSDSIVASRRGFEIVPGKDPNGWSFILEPYLWFDSHVDFSRVNVVKHPIGQSWSKGEVRKGK
jgi:hypothetical protein